MWYEREFYPRSRPRAARGGIKAQSKRGRFGESWWAQRWIAVLESFEIGGRLGRGRSYARNGQVLSIDIVKGKVSARVQGSRPKPYDVVIRVKTLAEAAWGKAVSALSTQALYAAKLLAGEMPTDIEGIFTKAKLSLFPGQRNDLETACSCPDWSNPCKHVAAVHYLLGEEFDRDPFLIFKLRGLSREELVKRLGQTVPKQAPRKARLDKGATASPLPADPARFWAGGDLADASFGEVQTPPVAAALPQRLGNFPFWRGRDRFLDALAPIYRAASAAGMNAFLGEQPEQGAQDPLSRTA